MKSESKENTNSAEESGKIVRSFRSSPEVENFYRFIYDNGMRREAHMMLSVVVSHFKKKRKRKVQ